MRLTPQTAKELKEDELVVLAQRGDPVAADALVERYRPRIRGVAASLCYAPEHREDAAQYALGHWQKVWEQYEPRGTFPAWTYVVVERAIRRFRDVMWRQRPWDVQPISQLNVETGEWEEIEPPDRDMTATDDDAISRATSGQHMRCVQECLAARTPDQQAVLIAHEVQNRAYEDIALETGKNANALRQLAKRGREAFKDCLEERARQGDEVVVGLLNWLEGLPDDPTKGDSKRSPRQHGASSAKDVEEVVVGLLNLLEGLPDDPTKGDSKSNPRQHGASSAKDVEGGGQDAQ